jgi:hypothetical protein
VPKTDPFANLIEETRLRGFGIFRDDGH